MERMLVVVDGSPESETIVPVAAKLAAGTGAEVHLFRVAHLPEDGRVPHRTVPNPQYEAMRDPLVRAAVVPTYEAPAEPRDQAIERIEHEVSEYLSDIAKSFERSPVIKHVDLNGDAAAAIIDLAKDLRVDLIAMATHGRSRLAALLLGSVASTVVRSGVAPVLLQRPKSLS